MFHQCPELAMVFTENFCFKENGIYQTSMGKRKMLMKAVVAMNIFLHRGVVVSTGTVLGVIKSTIWLEDAEAV